MHDVNFRKFSKEERKLLESLTTLMYRANELADVDGIKKYTLFPLIAYKSVGLKIPKISVRKNEIILGSFGFLSSGKRVDELINIANKMNVKLKLLLSFAEEGNPVGQSELKSSIIKKVSNNKNIIVKFGSFTNRSKKRYFDQKQELINELSECTHFIFSLKNNLAPSASMQFVKMFNKPIIGLNTFQSKQMQVTRLKCFNSRIRVFKDFLNFALMQIGSSIIKNANIDFISILDEAISFLTPDPNGKLNINFIKKYNDTVRIEDGLEYLIEIIKSESNE